MAKFKVGDKFYFPVQEDGDYKKCWDETGRITELTQEFGKEFAYFVMDNGYDGSCLLRRLQPVEKAGFTKSDLRTGMLVQLKDKSGDWYLVQMDMYCTCDRTPGLGKDFLINIRTGRYLKLHKFTEDLRFTEKAFPEFDVTKIAAISYPGFIISGARKNVESAVSFSVLWERPCKVENPKAKQMEALCLKLEDQLKEAREELQKIKEEG